MNIIAKKIVMYHLILRQMNQTTYDRFWSNEDNQFHFAQVICVLINCFLENHKTFGSGEK